MIISLMSQGGTGERGVSSPVAAQIECPDSSFVCCKQSFSSRSFSHPFSKPLLPRVGSGALIQLHIGD